jgi:hypothetical protein
VQARGPREEAPVDPNADAPIADVIAQVAR